MAELLSLGVKEGKVNVVDFVEVGLLVDIGSDRDGHGKGGLTLRNFLDQK